MKDLDNLTRYAKERVQTTQIPPSLYSRAEFRKNALDSMVTIVLATIIVMASTMQSSRRVRMEPPAVRDYLKQEFATVEVHQ